MDLGIREIIQQRTRKPTTTAAMAEIAASTWGTWDALTDQVTKNATGKAFFKHNYNVANM